MSHTACRSLGDEVLGHLPYGVLVVGEDGGIVDANAAAERLVGSGPAPAIDARCSDLFRCTGAGGPCANGCLAGRAALSDDALPEIRLDCADGGPVSALWVTAAPLGDGSRALLHLRPADARDRRRRTDPHWLSGPELRISALGPLEVESGEGSLGGRWLRQRPGDVLKYLICERGRVVQAEEIADALWPGAGRRGPNTVRHFVHALRQRLEPARAKGEPSAFVVTSRGGYTIDRELVRIDADEFETGVRAGLAAATRGDTATAHERLTDALALYRGDLLADELYAEWVWAERDRLHGLAARGLKMLASVRETAGDLAGAADALERLADLEPYDSDVHRDLLRLWLALGRRTEASRRYAAYRARLWREFGERPGFTLPQLRAGGRQASLVG